MSTETDTILSDIVPKREPSLPSLAEMAYATSPTNPLEAGTALEAVPRIDVVPRAAGEIRRRTTEETRQALLNNYTPENLELYARSRQEDVFSPDRVVISARALENAAIESILENDGGKTRTWTEGYLEKDHQASSITNIYDTEKNKVEQEGSSGFLSALGGFTIQAFAPSTQILGYAAKEYLGKQYVLNYGTMIRDIAQRIESQPTPELKREEVKRVLGIFKKVTSKYLAFPGQDRNDLIMYQFTDDLEQYLAGKVGGVGHAFNNFLGWVDATSIFPVVGVAKALVRGAVGVKKAIAEGRILPNTFLGKVFSVNPELGAKVARPAIEDAKLAGHLGTTPEQLASSALPQARVVVKNDPHLAGAPEEILTPLQKIMERTVEATAYSPNVHLYSTQAWWEARDASAKILSETHGKMDLHLGKSTIARDFDTNNVVFDAIYGSGKRGYASIKEATNTLDKNIDNLKTKNIEIESAKVMYLDKTTNQLVEVGVEEVPKKAEYFLKLSGKKPLYLEYATGFDEGDVKALSSTWKYVIADPHYRMGKQVDHAFNTASATKDVVSHNLTHAQNKFFGLSNRAKLKVSRILERGRANEEVYDWRHLRDVEKFSDKEIVGYFSQRALEDSLWKGKNDTLRQAMSAEGYKWIVSGEQHFAAIPIKELDKLKAVTKIFDPIKQEEIVIDNIEKLLKKGYFIGRSKKDIIRGGNEYPHILIRPTDTINDLPPVLLNYRKGHITTYYTDSWYVVKGVGKNEQVVATAISKASAKAHTRKLNEALLREGKEADTSFRLSKELDMGESLYDKELKDHTLDLWFEPKSAPLTRVTGEASPVLNAVEATSRAIGEYSSRVSLHPLIDTMTSNLKNMYPQFWDGNSYIGHSLSDVGNDALKRSNSVYDRIEVFKRTPTMVERKISESFLELDSLLNKVPARAVQRLSTKVLVEGALGTSPTRKLTGLAGGVEIALSPVKQAILNIATIPHIMTIDPVAGIKALGKFPFLYIASLLKHAGVDYSKVVAAAGKARIDVSQFNKDIDAFLSTGKLAGVDANVVLSEVSFLTNKGVAETILGRTWNGISSIYRIPVKFGRKTGIDFGESVYQAFLFEFQKERFIKANPGVDPYKNLYTIQQMASEGRQIGFDMTLSGRLPYQRGLLAPITQFLAMSHKAALGTLDALFNTTGRLSKEERIKYILGNTVLGGAAAWGIPSSVWENMKETFGISNMPAELDNVVRGGVYDYIGNHALQVAFDEVDTPRIGIAEVLSPNSRAWTFTSNIMEALFNPSNRGFVENILGAGGKNIGALYNYASDLNLLWGLSGVGYSDSEAALMKTIERTAEWAKPLNALIKYQYQQGLEKTSGELYALSTDKKAPLYTLARSEQFAQNVLGMASQQARAYSKLFQDEKKLQEDAKEAAGQIWRLMYEQLTTEMSPASIERLGRFMNVLANGDPTVRYLIDQEIVKLINSQGRVKMDALTSKMMNYYGTGPAFLNKLKYTLANSSLPAEEQERYIQSVTQMLENIRQAGGDDAR